MSELSKYLVEQILLEDKNPIKDVVVVYVGRFQPMHQGHFAVYQHLVKKFGKNNVYVGTSNKVDNLKSPFNFKEKFKIATTMYPLPKSKMVMIKNPYNPSEVLSKYNPETTAFVTVVSEKDKSRLRPDTGKYFETLSDSPSEGYKKRGYVYVVPILGKGVSGTESRNGLSTGTEDEKKKFFKDRVFGKFNQSIYDLVSKKLNEGVHIPKERIEEWMINESSVMTTGQADDGPNFFFPNYDVYKSINIDRAIKIGYEVVNMITTKELEDYYEHPRYPNGPVRAVTPFPAGVIGATTATNQVDIYSSDAYSKWFKHVTRQAALVGYSVLSEPNLKSDKKQSGDDARGDKKLEKEFENSLQEAITLPVEIGDTLLMGKFKNKKVVVKTIGKDEHGLPTINGKKVVNFRYLKEGFVVELAGTAVKCEKCNHSWEIESDDSEKYLCHSCGWDSQKQEYDFDAFDSWREKMGLNEEDEIEERSKGKLRPADLLRRKAAMAGKRSQIKRKRARTMNRRKSVDKLKKIAYKKAYLEVYKEFMEELFPGKSKSELTIQQAKVVHKNVLRKKKRVLKRARFKFLPQLRDAEVQKFTQKNEMAKSELGAVEKFADRKLNPVDVEFTKHFFDRVNDDRNGKEISPAELIGFFKRLSKHKREFKDFLSKYQEIMVKDGKTKINIPFVKQANQIIAKTVMRTANWTQHKTPEFKFETTIGTGQSGTRMGYPSKDDLKKIEKRVQKQRKNTDSNKEYQYDTIKENEESMIRLKDILNKVLVNEGGAATGGSPIPAEHTMDMYNDVVKIVSTQFKLKKTDFRPLGSTGKKRKGDFSGDIDIAVDAAKIGSNFKLKFDEVQEFIYNKLKSKFNNVVNMKGLGIISFLYPIPNSDKFGQTDIMLSDNLDLSSFMFHSPNFIENESKYKGLYRNDLLFSIVKFMPTNIPDEYFEDGKDKGEIKKFSKFTLSQKKGLITQLKSFEGKLGKIKNAKPVKGGEQPITNVPNDIVKYIFGDKYNLDDMKSFESVYKIVTRSDFKHKKYLPKIMKNFKDSILKKNLPLPSEIK